MVAEADAEHIEHLAFVPVRPAPDGVTESISWFSRDAGTSDAGARCSIERMQQIDHFEARLVGQPVDGGDAR